MQVFVLNMSHEEADVVFSVATSFPSVQGCSCINIIIFILVTLYFYIG